MEPIIVVAAGVAIGMFVGVTGGLCVGWWQKRADDRDKAAGCLCPEIGPLTLLTYRRSDCPVHGGVS